MKTKVLSYAMVILCITLTQSVFAGTGHWSQTHPRRAEVNQRLNNQNRRIDNKVKDGKMSRAEAGRLHHQDHQIRHEERAMASQNHGHITKQEQKTLNQQENGTSRRIRNH